MNVLKTEERIIDVNLNRLTEGLRVLEDIVRFKYENKTSLYQIRSLKRQIWQNLGEMREKLIASRRSKEDIGRGTGFDRNRRTNLLDVIIANLKRTQESARVLEELFKISNPKISGFFKKLRFILYDLEKDLSKQIFKKFNTKLYVIIDIETLGRKHLAEITKSCIVGGATMIQLREPKDVLTRQWLLDAIKIKKAIADAKTKLIINDRIDIVLAADANGVHLGIYDMPVTYARKLLGDEKIIGVTSRNLGQARKAEKDGADYVSVGSIFRSTTKSSAPVVGIDRLKEIVKGVKIPVVAIGGINQIKAKQLYKLGVDGVAVVSAVFKEVDQNHKDFDKKIVKNLKKFQ